MRPIDPRDEETQTVVRRSVSAAAAAQPRTPRPPRGSSGNDSGITFVGEKTVIMPGPAGGTKPRRRSLGRSLLRAFVLLLLGGAALAVGLFFSTIKHVTTGGSVLSIFDTFQNPRGQFPGKDRVNILLVGKDYNRYISRTNRSLNGQPTTRGARSDSIMMLSLDLATKRVSALSIPRDTWVHAPDGHAGKINGTYARGGVQLLSRTVADLLGVAPDYHIAIKADAVREMVKAVGGVEVETIDRMKYDDEWGQLHVDLPAGRQRINGDQAIGFARFREADIYKRNPDGTAVRDSAGNAIRKRRSEILHSKEEGDPRRMARQQQLIRAIIAEAKKPQNILRAGSIIDTAFEQLETNLHKDQIVALGALFRNLPPDQIQSATLEGQGVARGTYRFIPDEKKKKAMVAWLLKGDESAANRLTVVAVQNATELPGVARRVADLLREEGYDAKSGNYERGEGDGEMTATRILYGKAAVAHRAKRIAQLLGVQAAQVMKEPKPDTTGASGYNRDEDAADVTVVLGRDVAANFSQRSARR